MIRKKLDVLEEEEKRTLQYASIEGEAFHSTVLAKLLGADEIELEERLAHLARTHRLILSLGEEELPDGSLATRYRFAHALYQNSLYGDLVSKRRIQLHRQAGEHLAAHYKQQSPRIATQLALHFERGRDFEQAVEFLIHAGDNATKLFANAEAEEHYTHALELVGKLSSEPQHEKLSSLYQKRGAANMALGRFSQSVDDYTAMLEQARALGSLEKESAALNAVSFTLFFSHRLEEMEARSEEALAVAERAGNEALRLDTMGLVALKHLCYGELDEGKPILDEIAKSARAIDYKPALLTALTWRACLYFFQTDYERAVEFATAGRKLATELRNGFLLLTSVFFQGLSQGNLGRMSEALAILEEGIQMARRNGDSFWFPRMPNCIGWIHRELQDLEGAMRYDQQGLEVGREYHVLEAEANSLINLGIDHSHRGENSETLAAFDEVHEIFGRDAWFRWRYNIRLQAATAEHWLAQGDVEKTRKFALQLLEIAVKYEAHKYVAVAHKLLAQVALANNDLAEAQKQFEAGLEELRQFPAPLVEWKIYADLGRLKLRLGDRNAAQAAFAQAGEIVNRIADNTADAELKERFLNSDVVREVLNGAANTAVT